ncbi:MAG: hypothetical protein IJN17_01240 [Clostridia bacterium]|nr:hypothetical protein [Clostridia bacterium]
MVVKKIMFFVISAVLCFGLVSCGGSEDGQKNETEYGGETSVDTAVETVVGTGEETVAETEKTPENNVIEHKIAVEDLRARIVDYMRSMSAVEWTPNETFSLNGDHNTWGVDLNFKKGQTYYGLPYTRAFSGLDDFTVHIENGVYKGPCGDYNTMPGNNCSSSCDLAWRRYLVSDTEATYTYVPGFGNKTISPVGDYTYPSGNRDTYKIIEQNDQQKLFESYALVQPADAIVKWSDARSAGHARMVAENAVVVRNAAGKINAGRSYIVVIEQTNKLTTVDGKQSTWLVDKKYTFTELMNDGYIPVTPKALAEETELKITYTDPNTADNIVTSLSGTLELSTSVKTVNMTVSDENGNVVKEYAIEVEPGTTKINLRKYTFNLDIGKLPEGKYNYKLEANTPASGTIELLVLDFEK